MDVPVTITGYVTVMDTALIEIGDGSMTFENGSTYEHARDAGSVPAATWNAGSIFLLTGTEQNAPGNRNQDFYNVTFNTPDLGRNRDMGWDGITIGGDITVINTNQSRWQMASASATDSSEFSIMGDVIGREVVELVNDQHAAGAYSITWDAREYASGIYYYRISAGDFVSVRKLVLMK